MMLAHLSNEASVSLSFLLHTESDLFEQLILLPFLSCCNIDRLLTPDNGRRNENECNEESIRWTLLHWLCCSCPVVSVENFRFIQLFSSFLPFVHCTYITIVASSKKCFFGDDRKVVPLLFCLRVQLKANSTKYKCLLTRVVCWFMFAKK